jgi:hypothetical protein
VMPEQEGSTQVVTETIEAALERVTDDWMAIPGVEGTGIGLCDERPCIKVFVSRPASELDPPLPDEVGGHPVRVEPTGTFRASDTTHVAGG